MPLQLRSPAPVCCQAQRLEYNIGSSCAPLIGDEVIAVRPHVTNLGCYIY
jgi:hypothetical protein